MLPTHRLISASGGDAFSADQLLPDQSEQEGIHTIPCTMVLRLDRQEGCVNYVSPFLARLVKAPSVGRKMWHLATLQYHRWATPSTGRADSDYAVDRIA